MCFSNCIYFQQKHFNSKRVLLKFLCSNKRTSAVWKTRPGGVWCVSRSSSETRLEGGLDDASASADPTLSLRQERHHHSQPATHADFPVALAPFLSRSPALVARFLCFTMYMRFTR